MTHITRDDVQHLSTLSALVLTDEEMDQMGSEIAEILTYIERLNEVDTEGITPTYQVTGLCNRMREDTIEPSPASREALLALAPEQQQHQIKVPKVL